jgi:hypothetical protein
MTIERVEAREALRHRSPGVRDVQEAYETRESRRLRESVEAMRLATEEIDKKLGDAYPKGLVAEIEDIKKRLQYIEGRVHFLWDHQVIVR